MTLYCQESSTVTINYQRQIANGLTFYFAPTDTKSEFYLENLEGASWSIEPDSYWSKIVLWGTFTNGANYSHLPEYGNECGKLYYHATAISMRDFQGILRPNIPLAEQALITYVNEQGQNISGIGYAVNEAQYQSNDYLEQYNLAEENYSITCRGVSVCTRLKRGYYTYKYPYHDSFKVHKTSILTEHWSLQTYDNNGNRLRSIIVDRPPTSVTSSGNIQNDMGQIEIEKEVDTEAIEVVEYGTYIEIYKTQVETGFRELINSIGSIDFPVTYSVDCGGGQTCPEGTCAVLCGDTVCCYDSNGISQFNYLA